MIQHFLDYIAIERKYSGRTVEAYRDDLRDFCRFLGWEPEEFNPDDLDESDVKAWMLYMLEEQHQSPRSVKRRLSALRSFYKWALRLKKVPKDITARVIPPKADKPLPVFFRQEEMDQALSSSRDLEISTSRSLDDMRDDLIISLLYQTGMRQAELLGLTDADLNMQEGSVRIFGKRSKERIVPIGDRLIQLLRDYQAARAAWMPGVVAPTLFVTRDRQGEMRPLSRTTLYNIVRTRMGEVSTQQKRSPHVLRHTFATTMLNNGADIRTIQTLLGHANLRATQIYTHATFSQMQKAYENAHPRAKRGKKEE